MAASAWMTLVVLNLLSRGLYFGAAELQKDMCPSREFHLESTDTLLLKIRAGQVDSCTIRLWFPGHTWIQMTTPSYLLGLDSPSNLVPCASLPLPHVEVRYAQMTASYCGASSDEEVIFTFHTAAEAAFVDVGLIRSPTSINLFPGDFQLRYVIGKTIHEDLNGITMEAAQDRGVIVSHSGYMQSDYSPNINSTLIVTSMLIDSAMRIQFSQISLEPGCNDALKIEGLLHQGSFEALRICDSSLLMFSTTVISSQVSFTFQTDESSENLGFMLTYEITNAGCDGDALAFSKISYDPSRTSYTATCLQGYHFIDTGLTVQNIRCLHANSTWSATSGCSDIDECLADNGGCSDVCVNTPGSYYCACESDSNILLGDGLTCDGSDTEDMIPDSDNSATDEASWRVYVIIGVVVPLAAVLIILFIVYLIAKRRVKALYSSSARPEAHGEAAPHSGNSPTYAVIMKPGAAPPAADGSGMSDGKSVEAEYELATPVYIGTDSAKSQSVSDQGYSNASHIQSHEEENVDMIDNDLYGT